MYLGSTDTRVRPVAWHRDIPERLIVHLESGSWALWSGDADEQLVEIPADLAAWMCSRPELIPMPTPLMWFDLSALPLDPGLPARVG